MTASRYRTLQGRARTSRDTHGPALHFPLAAAPHLHRARRGVGEARKSGRPARASPAPPRRAVLLTPKNEGSGMREAPGCIPMLNAIHPNAALRRPPSLNTGARTHPDAGRFDFDKLWVCFFQGIRPAVRNERALAGGRGLELLGAPDTTSERSAGSERTISIAERPCWQLWPIRRADHGLSRWSDVAILAPAGGASRRGSGYVSMLQPAQHQDCSLSRLPCS
jgi:hypothetical protein